MNTIVDSGSFLKRSNTPHGKRLVQEMKNEVSAYRGAFSDNPAVNSGWGHAYFCSEDGAFLSFDLNKPTQHSCPVCGKVFSGEPYDSCWVYIFRYNAIRSAKLAAALYLLEKDTSYIEHIKTIVGFYAENYESFEEHGRGRDTASGNGRITPQALNEAIMLCNIVLTLELCADALDKAFTDMVSQKLLLPAARFVEEQKHIIHNIPCWINAAIGAVGLYTGDKELTELAFDLPLGLADQVRQGVTADKFWYEGSIHYNHFTLESFANLLLFAKLHGKKVPQDILDIILEMFKTVFDYSFSNGILPNPNDGWPNLNLKTYTYIYEAACAVFDDEALAARIQNLYSSPCERVPVPLSAPFYSGDFCPEWLLFSRENSSDIQFPDLSKNFAASNFAILRDSKLEVFFKYGHCSPSHAHPDKMNIEVMAYNQTISRDISNCGYAARLCPEYHRTSVGHNTVTVDGQSHTTTEKGLVTRYNEHPPAISAVNNKAYDGVDFARSIEFDGCGFSDEFSVSSATEHNYDWIFHIERSGVLLTQLDCEAADIGYSENGYQHLKDLRRVRCGQTLCLEWQFPDGITATQQIDTTGKELFIAKSYDNPVSEMRTTLILRAKACNAVFKQSFSFEQERNEL